MAPNHNSNSRLTHLTTTIAHETAKIQDYFVQHGLPDLSFDPSAPLDFPVPAANAEIQASRRLVINATHELHDLMVGPSQSLRWLGWSYNDNLSLNAVYRFNIAQAVPLDHPVSFDHVAKATGVDPVNVKRLVRHAMTNRIFCEPREGYVAHTAASRVLLDDPTMKDWVGLCTSDFFPAAAATVPAMIKWPGSQEPTQCGFSHAWNIDVPMFVEIGKNPDRAKRFGRAMQSLTGGAGYEIDHLVNGYPWEALGDAVVVDVGGSHGFVPVALGQQFPRLRFVVQDLPKTVAGGPATVPDDLSDRIQFQAHDFFDQQPAHGADVFFFRWIFHNWSDKYCIQILKNLIPALKPGARVLINENMLPKPGSEDPWDEKIIRTMDLTMLELLNARERAEEDYAQLFREADSRFKFLGFKRPAGSLTCIIEAVWLPKLNTDDNYVTNEPQSKQAVATEGGATSEAQSFDKDRELNKTPVLGVDTPMEMHFAPLTTGSNALEVVMASTPAVQTPLGAKHIEDVDIGSGFLPPDEGPSGPPASSQLQPPRIHVDSGSGPEQATGSSTMADDAIADASSSQPK
ncbi:S-adenosyl-L-methionine-dependent methyltransferase [Phyllosticta citrichinensis]|uniref:S-adenosyl-L-methionine-dependent methyltransferase n=1 Tax=Phyllosticta citrichinensis TaxID=1130410 RepID=A0ABR1XYI5_9PEZI